MKKFVLFILFFGVVFTPILSAQIDFRLDGGMALPLAKFADSTNIGIGGMLTVGYSFDENISLTLRSGYLHFSGKEMVNPVRRTKFDIIPILFGPRYTYEMFTDIWIFGSAEVGVYSMQVTTSAPIEKLNGAEVSAKISETKFGVSPSLGAQYKLFDNFTVNANINFSYVTSDISPTKWVGMLVGLGWKL